MGYGIRFFKTFEVLLFKLLEYLDLYRAKKSLVAVPSLATRSYTLIQAVVYNGTQEEVLGYRPRRLLHRILRGLPDLEAYESVKFQLAVTENAIRTIEASTENRGFVNLQLPWQMPWRCPKSAWIRMQPLGVETLLGRIPLGDYEVISHPVYFLGDDIERVIVSDIDDTIKDSRILETTGFKKIVSGLFLGHYYTYEPLQGMAEIYQALAAKGCLIVYVTSTPYQLTPFLLKFLKQCQFPEGPVFPRWLGYGRVRHKWRTLLRLLSQLEKQRCVLIGDSGEQDLHVYRRICETANFGDRVERVLIRHVPGTPVQKALHPREIFYGDVKELKAQLSYLLT